MKDVIIIAGPTAVGKSAFAVKLAKKLNTEIISADSMQIYKGMNIGTAKISKTEMENINHHLIDIKEAYENYSVQEFKNDAIEVIDQLHTKNKIPIIVGGTGLYIDALTHNFDFLDVKPDIELRNKLEIEYEKDPVSLLDKVININREHYSHLSVLDKKKIIRAIEVYESSGKLINYNRENKNNNYQYHLFVLYDDRKKLYERINTRVDKMIEIGLIQEVDNLLNNGVKKDSQSMKAIGYKEVISYINKEISYDEMIDKLKKNSRKYAKRQLTWFRRNELSKWINISEYNDEYLIQKIIKEL